MSFDPYLPYGPIIETTLRLVTWNVWGRYGTWQQRQTALEAVLQQAKSLLPNGQRSRGWKRGSRAEDYARRLADKFAVKNRVKNLHSTVRIWQYQVDRTLQVNALRSTACTPWTGLTQKDAS